MKARFYSTIELPAEKLKEMNKILKRKTNHPDYKRDTTIETFTAPFFLYGGERYEVDIKVCNGESPFVDAILFVVENGMANEWIVLEPSFDKLEGEYCFETDTKIFTVWIQRKGK